MRWLETNSGCKIQVDDEDYDDLKKYTLSLDKDGYAYFRIVHDGKNIFIHRLLSGAGKGEIADHKDGNIFNCQRDNLRIVNTYQSAANRARVAGGTSKYKGVMYTKSTAKGKEYWYWCAKLKKHGVLMLNKRFATELEAALAYDEAAKIHHGEYARLNFPV